MRHRYVEIKEAFDCGYDPADSVLQRLYRCKESVFDSVRCSCYLRPYRRTETLYDRKAYLSDRSNDRRQILYKCTRELLDQPGSGTHDLRNIGRNPFRDGSRCEVVCNACDICLDA